ncbi:MAG: hypothetical protein IJX96_02870 [Clostridia bacterium]|nr:hypothetical protein [Clostridia bacterium]
MNKREERKKNRERDLALLKTLLNKEVSIGSYVGVIKEVAPLGTSYRITVQYKKAEKKSRPIQIYDGYIQFCREAKLVTGENFPTLSISRKGNPKHEMKLKIEPYKEPKLSEFFPKRDDYNSKKKYRNEWEEYIREWNEWKV